MIKTIISQTKDIMSALLLLLAGRYLLEISTLRKDVRMVKAVVDEVRYQSNRYTAIAVYHRRRARKLLRLVYEQ